MPDGSSYSGQYPTKPKVGDTWSEADVPIAGIGNPSVQAITSPSVAYIKDVEEKRAKENTDYIPGGYTAWLSGDRTSPAAKKYMEIRDRDSQEEQQAAQDDRAKFFSSAGVSPIAATTGGAYQFGTGAGSSMSNMFKDPSFISWLQSGKNSMMMQYLFGGFGKGGNK